MTTRSRMHSRLEHTGLPTKWQQVKNPGKEKKTNHSLEFTFGGSLNIWSREINSKLGSNSMNWLKESSLMAWHLTRVRSTRRVHLEWSGNTREAFPEGNSHLTPGFINPLFRSERAAASGSLHPAPSTTVAPKQASSTVLTNNRTSSTREQRNSGFSTEIHRIALKFQRCAIPVIQLFGLCRCGQL